MKYPDYSTKEVKEALEMFMEIGDGTVPWTFEIHGISLNSPEYNVENYMRLYDGETTKLSRKDFIKHHLS